MCRPGEPSAWASTPGSSTTTSGGTAGDGRVTDLHRLDDPPLQGNHDAEIQDYEHAHLHILQMADLLSSGIIRKFRDQFERTVTAAAGSTEEPGMPDHRALCCRRPGPVLGGNGDAGGSRGVRAYRHAAGHHRLYRDPCCRLHDTDRPSLARRSLPVRAT